LDLAGAGKTGQVNPAATPHKSRKGEESNPQASSISGARNHPVCQRVSGYQGAARRGWRMPNLRSGRKKAYGAVEQKKRNKKARK
jgi:hypothetical protein